MAKKKNTTITDIIVYKFYSALGRICKWLFHLFFPKKLDANRERSDLNLLLFSGVKGGKMLKAVLMSVYQSWDKIPFITIATDGTPEVYFEELMKWWPFPYQIKAWKFYSEDHLSKGGENMVAFGELNLMGRKAAAILSEAAIRPTLYCDTDVLWFGEPRLPADAFADGMHMRISHDNGHFYHLPIVRYFKKEYLLEMPPLNSGVIFISGSVYTYYPDLNQQLGFFKLFGEVFAEQTLFAFLDNKLGDHWNLDDIILKTDDLYWPLFPKYLRSGTQFARHHVMTKHSWFWRDALYILLFNKKNRRTAVDA